ncbi:hypothetical protein ETD86_26370 [Nonomuraea turkmeniaca]|uniref:Uncharacterized protein n=1 Tax=Nonomuraea turkmeniaca TaxID=103838 RepID=A0A5S4FX99_9ACTN|nr:hypothetical protein [Nonomuraea turkmeniaca]TMR15793.1 hypothetical protein ETD86_26370 [Nonomuraea turkmeniaca]
MPVLDEGGGDDLGDVDLMDGYAERVGEGAAHHAFGADGLTPHVQLVDGELARPDVGPLQAGGFDGLFDLVQHLVAARPPDGDGPLVRVTMRVSPDLAACPAKAPACSAARPGSGSSRPAM